MLIDTTDREYLNVRKYKSRIDDSVVDLAPLIITATIEKSLARMSGTEVTVFFYLLGVSICRGQLAREITIKEFESGVKDDENGHLNIGTGRGRTAIRESLRRLSDSNLLNIYRKPEQSGGETTSRIYEINFMGMLPSVQIDEILGKKSAGVGVEKRAPPVKKRPPQYISNIVTSMKRIGDTSISFLAGSSLPVKSHAKGEVAVTFVGKKKPAAPTILGYASGAEAIAAVQAR